MNWPNSDTAVRWADKPWKVGQVLWVLGRGEGVILASPSRYCHSTVLWCHSNNLNMLVHHLASQQRFTSFSTDRIMGFHEGAFVPSLPALHPLASETLQQHLPATPIDRRIAEKSMGTGDVAALCKCHRVNRAQAGAL
jgi:hypothetical protein